MKKINVELELYDEWYDELKKEYELTKKVLSNRFSFDETFEQFAEGIIENLLKCSDVKRIIDIYIERKETSEKDKCKEMSKDDGECESEISGEPKDTI